jgi:hypothetical protein
MAQEFTIKSQAIEDKINQLLPSQGGFQPGVDFSASTMVIPIVDLTESAEGSGLRQDLQTSLSHTQLTHTTVNNTTSTIVNTTGYYRVLGNAAIYTDPTASTGTANINITDGFTSKIIQKFYGYNNNFGDFKNYQFEFIVKLEAGESLTATSSSVNVNVEISTRQIADISGNLINP